MFVQLILLKTENQSKRKSRADDNAAYRVNSDYLFYRNSNLFSTQRNLIKYLTANE